MDISSWRIAPIPGGGPMLVWGQPLLYAPFVVYRTAPAGVVQVRETEARDTDSIDRRVMTSLKSDGLAYSRDEFVEYVGRTVGLREWERAQAQWMSLIAGWVSWLYVRVSFFMASRASLCALCGYPRCSM